MFRYLPHRFNSDLSKYCDIMSGEQRPGVRHVGVAGTQVLPDTAHGASGPPRRVLETTRLRRLGSQTGESNAQYLQTAHETWGKVMSVHGWWWYRAGVV